MQVAFSKAYFQRISRAVREAALHKIPQAPSTEGRTWSIYMQPEEYCQKKAARSGSSFYYSFLFLPPERRAAITALYAFCREVDDAIDETANVAVAQQLLAWWREELTQLSVGRPTHPVTCALLPHIRTYDIPQGTLMEVVNGMEMDLQQNRYADFEGLKLYCYRVAGVVGSMAARIFGAALPSTLAYAEQLGLAFQLTNIVRDVGEDALRGRIYLPLEELQAFHVLPQEVLKKEATPHFLALMKFQADRAREHYRQAFTLLDPSEYRQQRPGLVMASIYSALLDEIERDGFRVLTHRTSLTPLRKLWLAWRTWMKGTIPAI